MAAHPSLISWPLTLITRACAYTLQIGPLLLLMMMMQSPNVQ
jgi:hypothetical protein